MSFMVIPDPSSVGAPGPTGPEGPEGPTGPSGANVFTASRVKTVGTSRHDTTTLTDDPDLSIPVAANTRYLFTAPLIISPGAGFIKFAFSAPSGASISWWSGGVGGTSTSSIVFYSSGSGCLFTGVITTGSTAGNLALQWCQNTSNAANTSLNAGSALVLQQIAS